jgi:RNA polymerase sigma factor (TIGR02999 family)
VNSVDHIVEPRLRIETSPECWEKHPAASARVRWPAVIMADSVSIPDEGGDPMVAGRLLELVYDELRRLAAAKLAREAPGQTLQPTALVNEAWLRLVSNGTPAFENRGHFFSLAAEAMRRILIDRARRKQAQRHGGEFERVDFDGLDIAAPDPDDQLLAVHDALEKFAEAHPVQAELVKMRYFAGLTVEEAAQLLEISVSTAKNYWNFSRAWLFNEIRGK